MSSRFLYADHINVPEVMEKGGKTYRLLHDHLGSPRFVVDTQTGEIAQELQYDAWGNITYDSNPGFQPFGFAGGIFDTHTRLLRLGARDYDPYVGRWTAKDPLGVAVSPNVYAYVVADPLNLSDQEGLQASAVPLPPPPTPTPRPPTPTPTPVPYCHGDWILVRWQRKFSLLNPLAPKCICWWLCKTCPGTPMIWSGDWRDLPTTEGQVIHTGGDVEQGDSCLCNPPSGQSGCPKRNGPAWPLLP
ncbi:MAG: RHS repeat domain-containing protein [Acidobacteriota bacterium]